MTHDELLQHIDDNWIGEIANSELAIALRAVVELHKVKPGVHKICFDCSKLYPCETIQAIEKELG